MAPQLKLIYFDARGRAELTRLILAQAGVAYEDYRFNREQWPVLKKEMPFGQVPVLEVTEANGEKTHVAQSLAIARYVASLYEMYGSNALEKARIDMIVDSCNDILMKSVTVRITSDEESKKKLLDNYLNEQAPFFLDKVNNLLKENKNRFLVGQKLSMADIMAANTIDEMNKSEQMKVDVAKVAPQLIEFSSRILNMPRIQEWINKRPKTAI